MAIRIGVDVGGTFTDLISYDDETGEVRVVKAPSTPGSPDAGVLEAVAAGVGPELGTAELFLHATTVGLNALLTRSGATVGLLTTRGFADVLEIRRGEREDLMNLLWRPAAPLVPRRHRLEAAERVRADGSVSIPLSEEECVEAAERFIAAGVEAVAIVFLNAYANPDHEIAAHRVLRDCGFTGDISLSHRVSGEFREYERTSTSVIDAYVRPAVSGYLRRLEGGLSDAGFGGRLLITRSGGGAMSFAEAADRPFETIQSGPAAGAAGAAELCRRLEISEALTADVGGTSFDTCLIVDGQPQTTFEGRIIGMPVQTPWVDVRSIGAGGGSIAQVRGGLLMVGPESAGALPGPACYGRGGTQPTVTDAAALLGMLGAGALAGDLRLDFDAAAAVMAPLADALGRSPEQAACGVLEVAAASMATAVRSVSIEQGRDPRDATLIAFGGAGPVFATLLADALDVRSVLVPNFAGNFSAWGLLGQDIVRSTARTVVAELSDEALSQAGRLAEELFEDLAGRLGDGAGADRPKEELAIDLRYSSQEHTRSISVPYEAGRVLVSADEIRRHFAEDYQQVFGHLDLATIELVAVRPTLRTTLGRQAPAPRQPTESFSEESLDAFSFCLQQRTPFTVMPRSALAAGQTVSGPLILTEETTTTYVDVGYVVEAASEGAGLILTSVDRADTSLPEKVGVPQ